MSLVGIQVVGTKELKARMIECAELAKTDKLVRKGMSNAARIVSRAQKDRAPVRRNANQKKWKAVRKINSKGPTPEGPRRLLKPGVLKRSIGFRVKKEKGTGEYSVVIGPNVGKKAKSANFAPHAAVVALGSQPRFAFRPRAGQIGPNKMSRGVMPANNYVAIATNLAAPAALAALEAGVQAEIAAVAVR